MMVPQMRCLTATMRCGTAWLVVAALAGCMAGAPTTPNRSGAIATAQPAADSGATAALTSQRGINDTAAVLGNWLTFETTSRAFERQQVAAGTATDIRSIAVPGAPQSITVALPELASVLPAVSGTDNGDGTSTVTVNRQGTRAEGPYRQVQTLIFAKLTRRPITYRDRLTVTIDGKTTLSQSRSKVWQADGRFTDSISITGFDLARDGVPPSATPSPWRMDATSIGSADGTETTIGTLRRADGTSLTVSRIRQNGRTTLDVTDSRQNLKLSGSSDNANDIAVLTILIDGQATGTVELPRPVT
jgi:hypothetical protein